MQQRFSCVVAAVMNASYIVSKRHQRAASNDVQQLHTSARAAARRRERHGMNLVTTHKTQLHYGHGTRNREARTAVRCWVKLFCWPCVGDAMGEPGDCAYAPLVLTWYIPRVRLVCDDDADGDGGGGVDGKLTGEYVKKLLTELDDVFAARVFEGTGSVEIEIRRGAEARKRVDLYMSMLTDPSSRRIEARFVSERESSREWIC
jgi:hypothetical protein